MTYPDRSVVSNLLRLRRWMIVFTVFALTLLALQVTAAPAFAGGAINGERSRTELQEVDPEAPPAQGKKTGNGNHGTSPESSGADSTGCLPATNTVGPGLYSQLKGTINGTSKTIGFAGLIYANIKNETKTVFCVNLLNPIGGGDCFNSGGSTTPQLTWLLQNYPPDAAKSNFENAARQAAVWYYSDGFFTTGPTNVSENNINFVTRVNQIISAVPADVTTKIQPPVMTIDPPAAITTLPDETEQTFTLTITAGDVPVENQTVALSTGFGALSSAVVTTDANGQATVTLTSANAGTANLTAQFMATIPAGTIFNPVVANKQQLILGQTTTAPIVATASATWLAKSTVVVHQFLDANANGEQDAGESNLANWETKLYKFNGTDYVLNRTVVTNANGDASFSVAEGAFRTTVTLPAPHEDHLSWHITTPGDTVRDFSVVSSDSMTLNYGALIYSVVVVQSFQDTNRNGIQEPGEPFLNDRDTRLDKLVNGNWVTMETGATQNGQIVFWDLPAARYRVHQDPSAGWQITTAAGDTPEFELGTNNSLTIQIGSAQAPTNVTLTKFQAKAKKTWVAVTWETGSELNVTGFNLWRSSKQDGVFKKLNAETIAAQNMGSIQSAHYTRQDKTVKTGKTYFYKIQILFADGTTEWSDMERVGMK